MSAGTSQLRCAVCQTPDKDGDYLIVNESWAGSWHSACSHVACPPCLRQHVECHMAACRAAGLLAVPCVASECLKRVPQRLVLASSALARQTAGDIDSGWTGAPGQYTPPALTALERCPCCAASAPLVAPRKCGHGLCEACWTELASTARGHLQLKCQSPGCEEPIESTFWLEHLSTEPAGRALAAAPTRFERLMAAGGCRKPPGTEPGPVCQVCREPQLALLHPARCGEHVACEPCWARWAEEQRDACVQARESIVRCIGPGCRERIDDGLWRCLARPGASAALAALEARFERRRRLQASTLFPAPMQVECPRPECVGIGYLGFDTVMCFMCEHLWVPAVGAGDKPAKVDVEVVMGVAVKRCPQCNEYIEKNGGCDHMTCRCRHEFYWSTLKPFGRAAAAAAAAAGG